MDKREEAIARGLQWRRDNPVKTRLLVLGGLALFLTTGVLVLWNEIGHGHYAKLAMLSCVSVFCMWRSRGTLAQIRAQQKA
ncbi:MAG TPA: hypothetical protein VKI45_01945 [Allosphingosinicella sp.]|nr:hypothetical protein [Allosphingosinicella sp.]